MYVYTYIMNILDIYLVITIILNSNKTKNKRSGDVGVSGARWYILATFSLVSILQDTGSKLKGKFTERHIYCNSDYKGERSFISSVLSRGYQR